MTKTGVMVEYYSAKLIDGVDVCNKTRTGSVITSCKDVYI